jgi:trehalose 6-phosphate phosphatase
MRSLFDDWPRLRTELTAGRLLLFLDFDGTLAPIVARPERASMPSRTREVLIQLSGMPGVRVSIVSGRSLADLRRRVRIPGAAIAGNHGLEIVGPSFRLRVRLPTGYRRTLDRIRKRLAALPGRFPGTELEDKGLTLSFHFRRAAGRRKAALSAFLDAIHPYRDGLVVRPGKRIVEIRPPVPWGKGDAVLWMLRQRRWAPSGGRISVVYLGDDRTDEDAFSTVRDRGLAVRVGRSSRSAAEYYLDDPAAVSRFLDRLLRMRKGIV